MKRLALMSVLLAAPAFADIVPEEVARCSGKTAGAGCTTPDGLEGSCVEISVSRPDYSQGVPPTYRNIKMLSCEAKAQASAKSASPWLGVGLAFLALIAAARTRRIPQPA